MRLCCEAADNRAREIPQRFRRSRRSCSSKSFASGTVNSNGLHRRALRPVSADLLVRIDQGEDVEPVSFLAAVEEGELDGEGCSFDDPAELLDEFYSGGGRCLRWRADRRR